MRYLSVGILLAAVVAPTAYCAVQAHGPVAVAASADGSLLYVSEYENNRISIFDTAAGAVSGSIELAEKPWGLALSPDGTRLYAAGAAAAGKVFVIDLASDNVVLTIDAGHTPSDVAVSPDGSTLYVCNRFDNSVGVYDASSGEPLGEIGVVREPVAAALTPDGSRLVVANHLPAGRADLDYVAAYVSIIDTGSRNVSASVLLPNGSTGLRGVCVSPDGAFAYVTHILGRYQLPTTQLERGWMNTNALSVIDIHAGALVNTILLDDVDLGAANPWGVACAPDGAYLCVAHAGTHELSVIDRRALHDKLDRAAAGERVTDVSSSPDDVPNDLSFLVDIRRRVRLQGVGPRGLAVAGSNVFAAEFFSDSVGRVDLDSPRPNPAASVALGSGGELSAARRGEMLFNDARMCFQYWQSCASCHPDARADALNWDLLNDGIGNPKNTKSMLLSHETPPVMALGVRDRAETAVRSGMRFIQFTVRPEEDAEAIDLYLKSMKPVQSPVKADEQTLKRGAEVFKKAKCADCHPASLYTDLRQYNLGTGLFMDEGKKFDTPTLVEAWRTAPYMHDGRAATMRDVLTTFNEDDTHGKTSNLTEQELDDLEAYVMTR